MNKYKRKSKTKTLALGIGILSSAAVVSTGFAAWIIAGGDSVTGTGSITAEGVSEAEHTIKFASDALGTIRFGAPKSLPTTTYNWLKNNATQDSDKENLKVSTTFTVENVTDSLEKTAESVKTLFDVSACELAETTTDDTAKYSKALGSNLVAAMPLLKWQEAVSDTAPGVYVNFKDMQEDSTTANFTLDIVFGWGSAFTPSGSADPVNPYVYYNNQAKTEVLKSDAKTKLDTLSKVNASFSLTLTTK